MDKSATEGKFPNGTVVYHLATNKRCVVISSNPDGTVDVETEDDLKRTYSVVALITEEEKEKHEEEKTRRFMSQMPKNKKDWVIGG